MAYSFAGIRNTPGGWRRCVCLQGYKMLEYYFIVFFWISYYFIVCVISTFAGVIFQINIYIYTYILIYIYIYIYI
jgi:hypothetical protein